MAEKAAPFPLSAVSVEEEKKKKKKQQQQHAAADPPFPGGVRHVIMWALFNAGCFVFSIAYVFIVTSISQAPSWLLPRPCPKPEEMTDAAVDVFLMAWKLWCVCVVSQAAAGVLALMIPRRRLILAYAALVATAAGHFMWAGLMYGMSAADDEGLCFRTGVNTAVVIVFGVVDIVCFRGLILGGGEEEEK